VWLNPRNQNPRNDSEFINAHDVDEKDTNKIHLCLSNKHTHSSAISISVGRKAWLALRADAGDLNMVKEYAGIQRLLARKCPKVHAVSMVDKRLAEIGQFILWIGKLRAAGAKRGAYGHKQVGRGGAIDGRHPA